MPRLESMQRYWGVHPPIHIIAAAYLGISNKPQEQSEDDAMIPMPFDIGMVRAPSPQEIIMAQIQRDKQND